MITSKTALQPTKRDFKIGKSLSIFLSKIVVYTDNIPHFKEADFSLGKNLKSKKLLLHGRRICPRAQEVKCYLKGCNSLKRNEHRAELSPFQVLLDIVVAVELGQVDEHAGGTAPVPPAAVAAVAHPTTRRTDPGLQGRECRREVKASYEKCCICLPVAPRNMSMASLPCNCSRQGFKSLCQPASQPY